MATDVRVAVLPPEGWERLRDRVAGRVRAALVADPARARRLVRARTVLLWAALALVVVMVVVFPRYRTGLSAYAAKHEGPVFRGTILTPEQISRYEKNRIVTEAAFTSTSTDPRKAFPGNVRFLIDSRTGRDVSAYSGAPEAEVLFDRDTVFEVLKTTTDAKGKTVIYLAEVP